MSTIAAIAAGAAGWTQDIDPFCDELARFRPGEWARLAAFLEDRRTRAFLDRIHSTGSLATRAELEDRIADAKRITREDDTPCPF